MKRVVITFVLVSVAISASSYAERAPKKLSFETKQLSPPVVPEEGLVIGVMPFDISKVVSTDTSRLDVEKYYFANEMLGMLNGDPNLCFHSSDQVFTPKFIKKAHLVYELTPAVDFVFQCRLLESDGLRTKVATTVVWPDGSVFCQMENGISVTIKNFDNIKHGPEGCSGNPNVSLWIDILNDFSKQVAKSFKRDSIDEALLEHRVAGYLQRKTEEVTLEPAVMANLSTIVEQAASAEVEKFYVPATEMGATLGDQRYEVRKWQRKLATLENNAKSHRRSAAIASLGAFVSIVGAATGSAAASMEGTTYDVSADAANASAFLSTASEHRDAARENLDVEIAVRDALDTQMAPVAVTIGDTMIQLDGTVGNSLARFRVSVKEIMAKLM